MFPFLLSSNENENHNENDSHFGPLRGRVDITFALHFRTSALRAFGLPLHFSTLAQETCATGCVGVLVM